MSDVTLSIVDASSGPAQWAMTQYFAELAVRFPRGFDAGDALEGAAEAYNPPNGLFVLAVAGDAAIGCGALHLVDGETAEVKRMWVSPSRRGLGLGRRLLASLEDEARRLGRRRIVLDTNGSLTEALSLYAAEGYVEIERYNDNQYAEHWLAKTVAGGRPERAG